MRAGLLSAGLAAILIGSRAALASYSFTTLTGPNADGYTKASRIHDTGDVGSYQDSSNVAHGFSYVSGAFTNLNFTLNDTSASSTSANGARPGFVLTPAGHQSFDVPGGIRSTTGTGINSLGRLVDTLTTRGFSANGVRGPPFALIDPTPNVGGYGNLGVNDAGHVVGSYIDGSGITQGFATIGTTTITLDDPLATGFTAATGINANGDLVGNCVDASGVFRGFVAKPAAPSRALWRSSEWRWRHYDPAASVQVGWITARIAEP